MALVFGKVNLHSVPPAQTPPSNVRKARSGGALSFARLYDRGEVARVTHDFKFSLVVDRTAVPVSRSESGK